MTRDEAADVILHRVLEREGAIGDAGDGAGETRWGQTPAWLMRFGFLPPGTPDQALANYRVWLVRTRLIGVCEYPDSLADIALDFAVNAGDGLAIVELQRALGGLRRDGILGPETQAKIDGCARRVVAGAMLAAKVEYRGDIITGNPQKHAKEARGWFRRDGPQIVALVAEGERTS